MVSQKQLAANKKNAKLWWVKTQAGKLVSRKNAIKQWLYMQTLSSPEEQAEYNHIFDVVHKEYSINDPIWWIMADILAKSIVRKKRWEKIEEQVYKQILTKESQFDRRGVLRKKMEAMGMIKQHKPAIIKELPMPKIGLIEVEQLEKIWNYVTLSEAKILKIYSELERRYWKRK